jgi:BirA family biotin operon repressor/biotin-[acetyl-CoA-carboxylase] ligase
VLTGQDLPDDFAGAFARAAPGFGRLGTRVLYFPAIGSTNDIAARLAMAGDHEGAIVIADAQTAGRGRRGRTWFSPAGSGLYVSIVLTPARADAADRAMALLTLSAGVALAEAIERDTGLRPAIKWPNDLLVGRRKLAGILAEAVAAPASPIHSVILGYGINVAPSAYPPELQERATSLESELGRPIDRPALCASTIVAIANRYDDLLEGRFDAILDAWRARAPGSQGARVSWEAAAGRQSGITAGIDQLGALLVRVGDRVDRIVAGEVQWG